MIHELRIYDAMPGKLPALNDRFANITHNFSIAHAGELLLEAAETGKRTDIQAATEQIERAATGPAANRLSCGLSPLPLIRVPCGTGPDAQWRHFRIMADAILIRQSGEHLPKERET